MADRRPLSAGVTTGTAGQARRDIRRPPVRFRRPRQRYVDPDPARRGKAGSIRFILFARFARGAAPTRRVIGTYGAVKLEDARRTAGEWRSLIAKGIDPAVVEAEQREAEARARAARIQHSFANVAETFIADKLAQERGGKTAERDFRSHFVAAWSSRPISEISPLDVLAIINAKKAHAPAMARGLLVLARRFFDWAGTRRH